MAVESLGALELAEVELALKDSDGRIREQAFRLAEPLLGKSKRVSRTRRFTWSPIAIREFNFRLPSRSAN